MGCIFIDLKKAFDTVPHEKMFIKLDRYGIRGLTMNLIRSYMKNRVHFVDIQGSHSEKYTNHNPFSVQQGSNLGPLLFLLYINDIFSIKLNGSLVLFTDDAMITYDAMTTQELKIKMEHDLSTLYYWFMNNKLTMNIKKTKFMLIAPYNSEIINTKLDLKIYNQEIEQVTNYKYLGLTIQNNLKWNIHINMVKRKISAISGIIKRMGNHVNQSTQKMIYAAYIQSQLSYLSCIWGLSTPTYLLNSLQVSQNNAVRNIYAKEYYIEGLHTNEIYKKHGIMKINSIIEMGATLMIHKILNNEMKNNIIIERIGDTQTYNTRNADNIRINNYRTNTGKLNVIRASSIIYNKHTNDINTTNTNFIKFKNEIKKQILIHQE